MYKAPLHIFVVWHPKFQDGEKIASSIYSQYTRNILEPLSRGIGIPVFFRSVIYANGSPVDVDLTQSENNAIIVLIDDKLVINWKSYVNEMEDLVEKSNNPSNRIFPVSLTKNFSKVGDKTTKRNFIRLHDIKGGLDKKIDSMLSQLTHEMCRLLLDKPRITATNSTTLSSEPVSLFISHAKRDGVEIAKKIKAYTDANKAMDTFFDSVDIAVSYKFHEELEGQVDRSALLVVQTDSYSSREWCRWEVLKAKKRNKPVIVINAIEDKEERSFPYLGNVPTIRWKNLTNKSELALIDKILNYTLLEILRYVYTHKYLTSIKNLSSIAKTYAPKILSSPPELLTLLEKSIEPSTRGKIVLYPDPPLTAEEINLLSEVSEEFTYLTPNFLLAYDEISDK